MGWFENKRIAGCRILFSSDLILTKKTRVLIGEFSPIQVSYTWISDDLHSLSTFSSIFHITKKKLELKIHSKFGIMVSIVICDIAVSNIDELTEREGFEPSVNKQPR